MRLDRLTTVDGGAARERRGNAVVSVADAGGWCSGGRAVRIARSVSVVIRGGYRRQDL